MELPADVPSPRRPLADNRDSARPPRLTYDRRTLEIGLESDGESPRDSARELKGVRGNRQLGDAELRRDGLLRPRVLLNRLELVRCLL